jgi:hypothetical protein
MFLPESVERLLVVVVWGSSSSRSRSRSESASGISEADAVESPCRCDMPHLSCRVREKWFPLSVADYWIATITLLAGRAFQAPAYDSSHPDRGLSHESKSGESDTRLLACRPVACTINLSNVLTCPSLICPNLFLVCCNPSARKRRCQMVTSPEL